MEIINKNVVLFAVMITRGRCVVRGACEWSCVLGVAYRVARVASCVVCCALRIACCVLRVYYVFLLVFGVAFL
jgi:hypothetical protein